MQCSYLQQVLDAALLCATMVGMTIFDCYKLITSEVYNYLMFLVMMIMLYFLFCMVIGVLTDAVCKVVVACRTPLIFPKKDEQD